MNKEQQNRIWNMSITEKDYFDVAIKILECGGLSTQIKDLSTQVSVQVGDEKKYSKVVRHTSKPFFDDYFVFTKFMAPSEFMDAIIQINVLHIRKRLRVRKLVGRIAMDIATVWNQPNRQLRKWFSVSLPRDRSAQRRAFVECDLRIIAPTKYHEWHQLTSFESSEIIGSKRARYKVLVYHCTGLEEKRGLTIKDQEVTVKAWYADKSKKTSIRKLKETVVWNEEITFLELFPPMRQRLTIEVCVGTKVIATKHFSIIDFFKIFHGGFRNMFGPTYIHLYEENDYRGSLLMSLESETLAQLREFEYATGSTLRSIEPVSQVRYGIEKTFVFCGTLFELIITSPKCGKEDLYLSLNMGKSRNVESKKYSAKPSEKFLHLHLGKKKPCISLTCEWPDCTHRLYNTNVLVYLTRQLKDKLDIATIRAAKGCVEDARQSLLQACHSFKHSYKRALKHLSKGITELDEKKMLFLKQQLTVLAELLTTDSTLDNVTNLCRFIFDIHNHFRQEIQDALPLLEIYLRQGKKTIGSCVLHPREVLFSDVKERRGFRCGKISNLCLEGKNGELVARMDMWLWLGKREQIERCKELFPPEYEPYSLHHKVGKLPLPNHLKYHQIHTYAAICHVHSGFIHEEAVTEGDCDSFVSVSFLNRSGQTITAKRTLAPAWKQTLKLMDIKLHLPLSYLLENPPQLTVQIWNDTADPPKLLGTGLVDSNVRAQPATNVTEFPLQWWPLGEPTCEILLACEIFPVSEHKEEELINIHRHCNVIPRFIEPPKVPFRFEVIFWGMRPLYARPLRNIIQPQVSIQFATVSLFSGVIARANTTFNFNHDSRTVSLFLPENRLLSPSILFKIMSNLKYLTVIAEKNIYRFEYQLPKKSQWEALGCRRSIDRGADTSLQVTFPDLIPQTEIAEDRQSKLQGVIQSIPSRLRSILSDFSIFSKITSREEGSSSDGDEELEQDWWDRYWNNQMYVYDNTLEDQEEYSGFTDVLSTFIIKKRNESTGYRDEIGKFKAVISLYKWPPEEPVVTMQGQDPETGILKLSNLYSRVNLLVRVYCVKATDLYPSDLNGKSDPYIEIATQSKTVSDSLNKILCELNPVFGNHHDIIATLPVDNLLAVRVMDWDAFSKDDLIGETIIDIENRFYSRHRATCGLPDTFTTAGPGAWRDIETPRDILEKLCNAHNLPLPQYHEKSVSIGSKEFFITRYTTEKEENEQRLALAALNNWKDMPIVGRPLVAEHVETRDLFKEDRPGLVRGRLTMWVDMFDMSLGAVPLPIEILPRRPQGFELRVSVLNTAKVPLVDATVGGDIMVTGWLGDPKNLQKTDVHHQSHTGAGNFNWRFVFPFLYYRKENLMVFRRKNLFDIGTTEEKVPPCLHLNVYDNEGGSEESAVGGMILNLCHMPRGAPSYSDCKAEQIYNYSNYVDLFRVERLKGWWPFLLNKTSMKERGYLEAEFFLITAEEARKSPAGLGRAPPDPLPAPQRVHGKRSLLGIIESLLTRHEYHSYFGFSLNVLIVLSLIVLIGLLAYTLPSTFDKLKPWLMETF